MSEENIKLKTLRELCFNGKLELFVIYAFSIVYFCTDPSLFFDSGIPFEGGIRALCWKVSTFVLVAMCLRRNVLLTVVSAKDSDLLSYEAADQC